MNGFMHKVLAACAGVSAMLLAAPAFASDMRFGGGVSYVLHGTTVEFRAQAVAHAGAGAGSGSGRIGVVPAPIKVHNSAPASDASGPLRMTLWALRAPYTGGDLAGYRLSQTPLKPVLRSAPADGVDVPGLAFAPPPDGTWYLAMALEEMVDGAWTLADVIAFPSPVTFADGSADVAPRPGLWWNPDESGSGYAIDYRHGTLVVVVFAYAADGASQWYIATGALDGNTFTGTLARTAGGQCIQCEYQSPMLAGDDGPVSIVFTSDTSGVMYFGGTRVIQVVPEAF